MASEKDVVTGVGERVAEYDDLCVALGLGECRGAGEDGDGRRRKAQVRRRNRGCARLQAARERLDRRQGRLGRAEDSVRMGDLT